MIDELLTHIGTAYFIFEWLIRLVMLIIVPLRRTPEATRSWLLLIFFLPVPGLLLYLAIGRPNFPEWRRERFRGLNPFFARLVERLDAVAARKEEPLPDLAGKLGGMPAVHGNEIAFLDDYDGTIDRLVRDIDGARLHVRLLVYIFADDATGRKVVDALARASARGVACHVLVDPIGSHAWLRSTLDALRAAGVEVREALPVRLWRKRTRRDMRNHRKIFLIDGTIGYVGSQNIVAKDFRKGVTNHELVVRIAGPAVAEMTAVFLADWYLETEMLLADEIDVPPPAGACTVQLLPSGATYPLEGFQTLLIWQVHAARERMMITSPYFIPDEGLLGALRTAVLRGVEIDLIVSAIADQPFVSLAQRSYYDDLLAAGVRIHLFRKFLLHAKNVSVDGGLAIVGSSNIDIRSFELNEEVSLLLYDRPSVEELERIQLAYIADSDLLDLETWRRRPGIYKLGENVARLVSPLL
jgi:cardiolipin synthase